VNKKKKIRKIKDNESFEDVFNIQPKKKEKNEDFERLLNEYENNPILQKMYRRKLNHYDDNELPVRAKTKTFPKPQATLDLHGLRVDEIEIITHSFIFNSKSKGLKTLRIITGKGIHSVYKPVLKEKMEYIANKLKREKKIIFWKWEKKQKEKSGSIIVFLN
jgi:DNA-nicking Smr family endonuclease